MAIANRSLKQADTTTRQMASSLSILAGAAFVLSVALVLFVAAFVIFYPPGVPPLSCGLFNEYSVRFGQEGGNYNFVGQRIAHKAALLVLAAICLCTPVFTGAHSRIRPSRRLEGSLSITLATGLAVCSLCYYPARTLILSVILSLLLYLAVLVRKVAWTRALALAGLALFLLAIVAPSQTHAVDLSALPQGAIAAIQDHYWAVVSAGDRLAAGQRIFTDVKVCYGQLLPCLSALWQMTQHATITLGQYMKFIQWLQIAFLAISAALYVYYSRKFFLGAFCAFILMAPWFQPDQLCVWFPNLSAWRLINFPLALATLVLAGKLPEPQRIVIMGIMCGIFTLVNFETGICILLGFAAFLSYQTDFRPRSMFARIALMFAISGLVVALCLPLFYAAFGYWPNLKACADIQTQVARVVETGYAGGFRLEAQPFAIVAFVQSCFVLIYTRMRHKSDFRSCLRCCIAAMSVVWFSYYVNRPRPWYLCAQYFLFGFFLIDLLLVWAQSRRMTSPLKFQTVLLSASIALVVIPQSIESYRTAYPLYAASLTAAFKGPVKEDAVLVSGLYLPEDVADELIKKSEFIKTQAQFGPVPYLSNNSILIANLSGVQSSLPVRVVGDELCISSQFDRFIDDLAASRPAVFVDAEDSLTVGVPERVQAYADLRRRLSRYYERVEMKSGWEKWQRRGAAQLPGSRMQQPISSHVQ